MTDGEEPLSRLEAVSALIFLFVLMGWLYLMLVGVRPPEQPGP
jgi:hypothetical protein